jgi:hypothetical protein
MAPDLVAADLTSIWQGLEATPVGAAVRESLWLFPAIETLHLIGMAALITTIAAFDLRLLGLVMRDLRVQELARRLFPWAWAGFSVQVVTGALLFSSEATKMAVNPAFRLKMLMIALAGLHAVVFRWIACRDMPAWAPSSPTPLRGKIAGFVSLLLWIGVVAAGRWIGFI